MRTGRLQRVAVKVPFPGQAGVAVRVAQAHPQHDFIGKRHAKISALQRVGIRIVYALSVSVELVGEEVVIETSSRPGERRIAVRGSQVSAVSAKTQLWSLRRSLAGPNLHYARHRVGAIQRALRAPDKFQAVCFS